jgi:glutaredoxin 3
MNARLYVSGSCPWCGKARELLKGSGVEFEEVNIDGSQKASDELMKKSRQMGVPVIEVGDKIIVGYDEQAILDAIKK